MKKFLLLFLFSFFIFPIVVLANKQISGIVVDEKGEPIIGASVQVKGETVGTVTDIDGNFSLSVPDNAETVVVSYIGMQTKEEKVQSVMRVTLSENAEVIQEVVVTGYGSMSKGSFAGSAQSVDASEIEKKSPSEISKALAGEIAGVQVVNTTGQPGMNATIRIRGIGSLNSSANPLYVVDGMVYEGDVSSIDPSDIASTTVLKDATATALYGSRGANGVIVITTKKGNSSDKGKIEVSASYGANMHLLPMYDVITNPKEYVEMCWLSLYNASAGVDHSSKASDANSKLFNGQYGLPVAYNLWNANGNLLIDANGKFFDYIEMKPQYQNMESWEDAMFRTGQKATATVKVSGGNEAVNYYVSLGYLEDEGYYQKSDFDRFNVRSNLQFHPRKWLKGGINMNYAYMTLNNPGQTSAMNNGFNYVNSIPPIYPVYLYNEDGSIQRIANGDLAYDYGDENGRLFGSGINPAGSMLYDKQEQVIHDFSASGFFEFKLYKELKLETSAGVQYDGTNLSRITNKYYGDAAGSGYIYKSYRSIFFFETKELLKYNKLIGDHNIDIFGGHETNYYRVNSAGGNMKDMARGDGLEWSNAITMRGLSSSSTIMTIQSFLAQVNYYYKERYGINATYRADGSSLFAKGHRWGHFGSAGVAWKFTQEDFLGSAKSILKDGKLRFSYGLLGNQGSTTDGFRNLYSVENIDGKRVGLVQSSVGNPDITWERTRQFDVGLELSIKNYASLEVEYFHKTTLDMLMPKYQPPSLGYSSYLVNDGQMTNQGVEFKVTGHVVDKRNVKLNITVLGGFYRNKITKLPKLPGDEESDSNEEVEMATNAGLMVGHSVYEWKLPQYVGVDDEGVAQYVIYYDANKGIYDPTKTDKKSSPQNAANVDKDAKMTNNYIRDVATYRENNPEADIRTTIGTTYSHAGSDYLGKTSEADLEGGLNINLEVYGVTLDVLCGYRFGGYGYDNTYNSLMDNEAIGRSNWHVDMRNAWTEKNTGTDIPKLDNNKSKFQAEASDRFLTKNNYFSLNTIRLGYNFPKKMLDKIRFNRLEVYVQGDNLAIVTARKGYNPMVSLSGSSSSYQYTPLSTIIGGLKFEF